MQEDGERKLFVEDFYFIVDIQGILKLIMILKAFESQIGQIKMQSKLASQPLARSEDVVEQKQVEVNKKVYDLSLHLQNCFVEIPAKEGKNSLFLAIDEIDLKLKPKRADSAEHQYTTCQVNSELVQIFVANQFKQRVRYNLIKLSTLSLLMIDKSVDMQLDQIVLTLNENYILLLSKLIDENFYEVDLLLSQLQGSTS